MKMACRRDPDAAPTFLLQADRLLARDLTKGVHAHLHVGQLDAGAVARDADADGVVDDALHADEDALEGHGGSRWRGAAGVACAPPTLG